MVQHCIREKLSISVVFLEIIKGKQKLSQNLSSISLYVQKQMQVVTFQLNTLLEND